MNIFEKIAKQSQDNLYYLKGLNKIEEIDLEIYREIGNSLTNEEILELINHQNWRNTLQGYLIVVANNRKEFIPNLKAVFENGSFVSPQLAAALVTLDKKNAGNYLAEFANNNKCNSKKLGSILAVLNFCSKQNVDISLKNIELSAFKSGYNVAQQHVLFWHYEFQKVY